MTRNDSLTLPEVLKGLVEHFERLPMDERMSSASRENLDRLMDRLIVLYVTANIDLPKVPLKEFMNDLEKRMIELCLSLTLGNQRNAASILGVKPTALFEKIRKHGIQEAFRKTSLRHPAALAARAPVVGSERRADDLL